MGAVRGWERQLNETKGNRGPDDWLGILGPQHAFRFPVSLCFAASPNRQPLTANRLLGDDVMWSPNKKPRRMPGLWSGDDGRLRRS